MTVKTMALFGEAEKGNYASLSFITSVAQLSDTLGTPPPDSNGLSLAIKALLFEYNLIYIRVREEGFSIKDYLKGLRLLQNKKRVDQLTALCMPGVGDHQIIEAAHPICVEHSSLLVLSSHDLYDFLTASKAQPFSN